MAQFYQTSKVICGCLTTIGIRSYMTGVIGCPGCRCQKETLDHVLKCPNKVAKEARKIEFATFRRSRKKERIP